MFMSEKVSVSRKVLKGGGHTRIVTSVVCEPRD